MCIFVSCCQLTLSQEAIIFHFFLKKKGKAREGHNEMAAKWEASVSTIQAQP